MLNKLGTVVLCLSLYAAEECGAKSAGGQGQTAATPAAVVAAPAATPKPEKGDACALVEASEVEAVQGGRVSSARPAQLARGPLAVAQCHYAVTAADRPGLNLGVLVEVRSAEPAVLAEEWGKLDAKKENKRSERPRAVEGVGRGAYWVGNDRLGALYVLGEGRLLYISLGGPGEVGEKIEKSKRLALKALARL
jgi:hypothetical protein